MTVDDLARYGISASADDDAATAIEAACASMEEPGRRLLQETADRAVRLLLAARSGGQTNEPATAPQ